MNQENANKQIEVSNKNAKEKYDKGLKKYNQDLAIYNEQKAKLEKLGLVASSTGVNLYGDYNESGRGSLDFYKNFHSVFEGVKDLEVVDGFLSASPKTEVKLSRSDLLEKTIDTKEGVTGFFLKNMKKGDYFTLNNIGRTESGKSILAKFTFTSDPVPEFKVKGNDNIQPRMNVLWSKKESHSAFDFSQSNYQVVDLDIEYFDEATGKPINLAYVNVLTDLDYDQMYRYEYQDGSTGILKIHPDSELTKVVENGKEFIKGTVSPVKFTYDDTSGLGDYSVGSVLGSGALGESSVPKGSLLSIGWGSKNHLTYTASRYSKWVGTNNTRPESHYYAYKAYLEEIAKKEGKPAPTDLEITNAHGYTFGLWGVNSSIQRPVIKPVEPVKPELKQKDTKEIPMPTLEKPKEFVPRTTLPIPPAPTPPEKKKIPEMPLVPFVKVNYSRLRVQPSTPKPVKAITDNYGHNIDGANTFDKNVKFSLTTDYKPYSTFTTDSKTYGKTWAMVDDVQDGAYKVDDSKITMKDSTGKDVKALFNMYHVLSEKERTEEIQNILKEAGLNPKGEFYLWVAKDSASFYKNYVKQAKNITIDLPARLLVEKGKIVKNDFNQIDFGNASISNLVTVQVPDLKPEKHAVDQKDDKKIRDGQEIKIGEYLRYFLDGVTVPVKHDTLYQYDGIDMLDLKHDRYTGNWKGIIKGTEYTAQKDLTLPYDVILKGGKVVKAGDKIAKGSTYAFQFEFDQSTNSDFIKKIVKVTWNEKEGKWAYSIDKDFLNSLGVKGTFDVDFYIEVQRIESGDKIENTFVNIVNKQEMGAKVVTRTPEPPMPKHSEKHALDRTGQKVLDGKEVGLGEYIQYLLDGATVPESHHTLYQYDGIDMLDLKHDRYTGNWKGIIKGTEYTAEKDLTLPYDVILKDGKVVKAGDKIAKGSSYAFTFEFNQSTNSEFIKKIVKVTWNEKDGKWAYTIDKEFLNSLGVKGTFDADFYIEVERIASGDVENTFVNIFNGQEMESKVVTHTPEQLKPQEPKKPSLPNTGTASSMLGFVGTGILSMLGLVGIKRKKD